jgi:hypothetical protein
MADRRRAGRIALLGLCCASLLAVCGDGRAAPANPSPATAKPVGEQAMADYRRKLAEYNAARQKFEAVAGPYWETVDAKRKARRAKIAAGQKPDASDYVLTQPPKYAGPPRPRDPSAPEEEPEAEGIPVVADFLRHAREQFGFEPEKPDSETAFKRAYAAVASAAGLTREQAVRVYAFESGGNGPYDVQAGLETQRPGARAISTALGYNQLLTANTASILAEKGERLVAAMQARMEAESGARRKALARKVEVLRRMVAVARSVPADWSAHVRLGRTPKGLGLHALNLDIDVGPLLQTQKLMDSVLFARRKGIARPLTAAELEMMNLTGDGNGFDMVSMPQALRAQVPTANFFQRRGYERNPIAGRTQFVDKLIASADAVMDRESQKPGARELAAAFPD